MAFRRELAVQESRVLRAYAAMGRKPPPSTPPDYLDMYLNGRTI